MLAMVGFLALSQDEMKKMSKIRSEVNSHVNDKSFTNFKDFYPYYLSEYSDQVCRSLHYIGSVL